MMPKKTVVIADTHCGHVGGLNAPDFISGDREQVFEQSEMWEWFGHSIKINGPYDCAVWMGDLIDGVGVKDPSETKLNLNDQKSCAREIVRNVDAPVNWFLYGTDVHTGTGNKGYEIEKDIAELTNSEDQPHIYSHLQAKVDDFVLDFRHQPASNSHVETSMSNPLIREHLVNKQWFMEGRQQLATHIFRAHTHKMVSVGIPNRWVAHGCPALQRKTKYGTRRLSNVVHCGYGVLTFQKEGWPAWEIHEPPKPSPRVFKLFTQKPTH